MLLHFAYAAVLVFGTVFIHAGCTAFALGRVHAIARHSWALHGTVRRAAVLGVLVFLMAVAALLESALWAGFFWKAGALPEWEQALYFSLVTFTTLGYGDVILGDSWRMLGAFEAANGIIMFGWTTALIVAASQRLFLHHDDDEAGS